MNFCFAPLEGITGYVYRNVHHELFGDGIAAYYTPFVVSNYTRKLKTRERKDVLPENNAGTPVVPQILANDPEEFLFTARWMADLGYREVNINLGCPVRTVVVKGKGSGMLRDPAALDRFLDGVFEGARKILVDAEPAAPASVASPSFGEPAAASGRPVPLRIGVKTRLGFESTGEWPALYSVYARYPLARLIIHARTATQQYAGTPALTVFRDFLEDAGGSLPFSLCYNGNINTVSDYQKLLAVLGPEAERLDLMLGRGLVASPGLVRQILTGQKADKAELRAFHDRLYEGYLAQYASFHTRHQTHTGSATPAAGGNTRHVGNPAPAAGPYNAVPSTSHAGDLVVVNRMKEVWTYLGRSFDDQGRFLKNIHKAGSRVEYEAAVRMLFANCPLTEPPDGLD